MELTAKPSPRDLLGKWLLGNADAIAFILMIHKIAELWDDLIDKDVDIDADAINGAFYAALIALPRNRFYQQNFADLNPILEQAILDWQTANALELKRDADCLRTAFILKCGFFGLTVMAAKIVGGPRWAIDVNAELRQLGETWAQYTSEFGGVNGLV